VVANLSKAAFLLRRFESVPLHGAILRKLIGKSTKSSVEIQSLSVEFAWLAGEGSSLLLYYSQA